MKKTDPRLVVRPAPFLRPAMTTPQAMRDVLYALVPVIAGALWLFGLSALLVLIAAVAGALITEWVFSDERQRRRRILDGSALVTGLLLGLSLPPALPLWMAFVGGVAAIGLGKLVWGGLGQNLFNPALVGRAFLMAAFPSAMTTWTAQVGPAAFFQLHAANLASPLMHGSVDAATAATPLGLMKFQGEGTPLFALVVGDVPGSFGETSGLLILLGAVYLVLRRVIDWRIPAAVVGTVALMALLLHGLDPGRHPGAAAAVFSGGLLLGAVFMATDPATSPITPRGAWVFGIGIGVLVVLIRGFGGFPEGVMYAILLMNAAVPLIERMTQPRPFGRGEGAQ